MAEADLLNLECKSNRINSETNHLRNISFAANNPTLSLFSSSTNSNSNNSNNFENMDDLDANAGYKLAKFTSKNVTKK